VQKLLVANRGEIAVRIIRALNSLRNKRQKLPAKKHGNIPL